MREYVITLIVTVAVCSLAAMLAPEDERGLGGYTRLVAGLCVLCVAVAPLTSFLEAVLEFDADEGFIKGSAPSEYELEKIYEDSLIGAGSESVADGLASMLCRKLGLEREDIEVYVELQNDGGEYQAKSVTVILHGKSAVFTDPHDIIDYVDSLLGCRCEIIYG